MKTSVAAKTPDDRRRYAPWRDDARYVGYW
jgi:hypothetical protein